MNDNQIKQALHARHYSDLRSLVERRAIRFPEYEETEGVFQMPNRSSVDNSLNNHRTLYGTDNPHARLISKIRMALQNLPASRQDEYLRSLRLI